MTLRATKAMMGFSASSMVIRALAQVAGLQGGSHPVERMQQDATGSMLSTIVLGILLLLWNDWSYDCLIWKMNHMYS